MSQSDEQWEFMKDWARLILFIESIGEKATSGEVQRTREQQGLHIAANRSWTMDSYHIKQLAGDANIFIGGHYVGSMAPVDAVRLVEPIGSYWESLSPKNVWGGRWKKSDVPHFERRA